VGIATLYIDREIADHPETRRLRDRIPAPVRVVEDAREVYAAVNAAPDPVAAGKKVLFLTRNRGAFVRPCPGTRHYTCCDYTILHVGSFCTMDCAYCILQSYFHPPVLTYFVNHEEMLPELDAALAERGPRRFGTGEFTDSLIWEPWTGLSEILVPRFARQDHAVLELKTKTAAVDRLLDLDHRRRTALAWSVNTETVVRVNERGTASLSARLRAARTVSDRGYPVAFHFDPMVLYDGCEVEYRAVVRRLFEAVPPENVLWISLGTFRFMPDLKPLVRRRFPESKIPLGEFIRGMDDKMRYFKPLRIGLYRAVAEAIRAVAPEAAIYFCMEDDAVWRESLGFVPAERGGLPRMLDRAAVRVCGLSPGPESQPPDDRPADGAGEG
jgi:spore photoproduct lyase